MPQRDARATGVTRPRNPMSILARWLGTREWLMRLSTVIIWIESRLRRLTNNRASLVGIAGLPSLQITVPGRKSGVPRTTALLCVPLGESFIVTGSNWGRPKHPVWSANLAAVDHVQTRMGARSQQMSVRLLAGTERERLWQAIVYYWPGYGMEHRIAGGREFRMFLLEPIPPASSCPSASNPMDEEFDELRHVEEPDEPQDDALTA